MTKQRSESVESVETKQGAKQPLFIRHLQKPKQVISGVRAGIRNTA